MAEVRITVWVRRVAVISNIKRDETDVGMLEVLREVASYSLHRGDDQAHERDQGDERRKCFLQDFPLFTSCQGSTIADRGTAGCKPTRLSGAFGQR